MDRASKWAFVLACVVTLFLSFGCSEDSTAAPEDVNMNGVRELPRETELELPEDVDRVRLDFNGSGSVTLRNLSNCDVFLVKVNTSISEKLATIVPTDSVPSEHPINVPAGNVTIDGRTITRYERHWQGPYPAANVPLTALSRASVYTDYTNAQTVGDKKDFFVDVSTGNVFTEKSATLKVIGKYCKVWIVDECFDEASTGDSDDKVDLEQLKALADKFDEIYPLETALLGYEYGGGPDGDGGVDGDPKIQILVFDIDGDANDISRRGMTLGYFYQVDEYTRTETNPHSNEAEIFYLDSEGLDKMPHTLYSTLIHEFNHMINFNVKVMQTGSGAMDAWYTEMLSMLAEDAIGPLVGIPYNPESYSYPGQDNGNVITARIHSWLSSYDSTSVMYWQNSIDSYAANYAFGAYLVRNFGGPELLSDIAKSPLSGKDSLNASLRKINNDPDNKAIDYALHSLGVDYALYRFGEVLVYSGEKMPTDVFSFDKTIEATIEGNKYTFHGFNIWEIYNDRWTKGPIFSPYEPGKNKTILPNVVQLFSQPDWLPVSKENLTITIKNGNSAVRYYAMRRPTSVTSEPDTAVWYLPDEPFLQFPE